MTDFLKHLQHCTNFSGYLRRSEFWRFVAVHFLISLAIGLCGLIAIFNSYFPLQGIERALIGYAIFALLTSISAMVRRLNDAGQSRWKILLLLIPVYGHALLVVELCKATIRRTA